MMEKSQDASFKVASYVFTVENAPAEPHDMYPSINFPAESPTVSKRNERERNRVRLVNEGFSSLRQKIPFAHGKKRLSKVETLRYAVEYIKYLQAVIREHDERFPGDVIKRQERKALIRLHRNGDRISSDVIDQASGKKAMLKLTSTRAQERWRKLLTDKGGRTGDEAKHS